MQSRLDPTPTRVRSTAGLRGRHVRHLHYAGGQAAGLCNSPPNRLVAEHNTLQPAQAQELTQPARQRCSVQLLAVGLRGQHVITTVTTVTMTVTITITALLVRVDKQQTQIERQRRQAPLLHLCAYATVALDPSRDFPPPCEHQLRVWLCGAQQGQHHDLVGRLGTQTRHVRLVRLPHPPAHLRHTRVHSCVAQTVRARVLGPRYPFQRGGGQALQQSLGHAHQLQQARVVDLPLPQHLVYH
mmetsp:Transcript_31636/g.69698  ORF Transcript_31636/g.69698 Transcript_31636/m.69698 type:complete len:242 (-) Transcript_31636:445-1170(-)